MGDRLLRLCAVLAAPLIAGCAVAGASGDDAVDPALRSARFVLLGELHDNPAHHLARAELLRALLADRRPTRVLFEQMPRGREAAIAAAPRDAEAVASAGRLDRRAWAWPLHKPLIEAALAGGATLAGANLEREQLQAVAREGPAGAPPELRRWLAEGRWSPSQQATLESLIDRGHCGLLPRSQWQPMVLVQRSRDAAMAQALLDTPAGHRAVLIAGNGHVRDDVGVPHYLRLAGVPARDIVGVAYLEQGAAATAPEHAPFDIVRVTPPAPRADPCETLRGQAPAAK